MTHKFTRFRCICTNSGWYFGSMNTEMLCNFDAVNEIRVFVFNSCETPKRFSQRQLIIITNCISNHIYETFVFACNVSTVYSMRLLAINSAWTMLLPINWVLNSSIWCNKIPDIERKWWVGKGERDTNRVRRNDANMIHLSWYYS